ncbi:MAG: hypothetical protein AAGB22_13250, partial [Bacteroidota bacterium]
RTFSLLMLMGLLGCQPEQPSQPPADQPPLWEAKVAFTICFEPHVLAQLKQQEDPNFDAEAFFSSWMYDPQAAIWDPEVQEVTGNYSALVAYLHEQVRSGATVAYESGPLGEARFEYPVVLDTSATGILDRDTIIVEQFDDDVDTVVVIDTLRAANLDGLTFHQEWYYDRQQQWLSIASTAVSLDRHLYDNESGTWRGARPEAYLRQEQLSRETVGQANNRLEQPTTIWATGLEIASARSRKESMTVMPNDLWTTPLKSIFNQGLAPIVYQQAQDSAYRVFEDEEVQQPSNWQAVEDAHRMIDTVYIDGLEGSPGMVVVESVISPEKVVALRVYQHWRFDAASGRFAFTVEKIAPMQLIRDDITGATISLEPVCWLLPKSDAPPLP